MTRNQKSQDAAAHGIDAQARRRALAQLLPMWPKELDDLSLDGRKSIVAKLARALRAERRRGRAGHWTYDLARHAALLRIWTAERRDLNLFGAASLHATARRRQTPR